jgi:transposase
MSMSKRAKVVQDSAFVPTHLLPTSPGHPFYEQLSRILSKHGFDDYVESKCEAYYAAGKGRPSIPPGVYFRMLMIGYFEGLDSERGIAWKVKDSLSLRSFLGYSLDQTTPDHSSLSRIRQRLPLKIHEDVFQWVLAVLAKEKLLKGKTVAVDATTLEANAAMRSIVRRDTGETYPEYLRRLAKESGVETPTREDLKRFDKKRKNKKTPNDEWHNRHDPDAKILKMKDGRTHLTHKAEHVIDLDTNALVAVALPKQIGDTESLFDSLLQAEANLEAVVKDPEAGSLIHDDPLGEIVTDKGYHSDKVMEILAEAEIRSYIPEPDRGRRNWNGKRKAQAAVYANRRRMKGNRGQSLRKLRAERSERNFAHAYETGGMRRTHLRGRAQILKRLLIHCCGLNLGLLMKKLFGAGTPKGLADLLHQILRSASALVARCGQGIRRFNHVLAAIRFAQNHRRGWGRRRSSEPSVPSFASFSTGC